MLKIVGKDPWLEPVADRLQRRHDLFRERLENIRRRFGSLYDYADRHLYYGFHYDPEQKGWWFRDWLPGARGVYLFGDFNDWQRTRQLMRKDRKGDWSLFLPDDRFGDRLRHGSLVKMLVYGDNGWLERVPAYIRRAVQDEETKNFTGQFWNPPPFDWQGQDVFDVKSLGSLIIYESHVGMAQEKEGVGTYAEFTANLLPRIKDLGYNAVQLMAVAEHPYYGSFGYHVSNFFAPSSRFGTPEELKELVRTAHSLGIAVIMDLVHSHYVKNINEGLNRLDGSDNLYSPPGDKGTHPFWDSMLFDYGKAPVQRFLLSNVRYWMEEFKFDGFRFDGVTSMLYSHHGLENITGREDFFNDTVDLNALTYLTLANELIHEIKPDAVTIAEEVSGMPGMAFPVGEGGVGFDYRLGMAIPDYWIRLLEEQPDEEWEIWGIWNLLMDRLPDVKTVAYCESHDQAIVGDQTIAFRLMDQEMYRHMDRTSKSLVVDRGIALHKLIRFATITLGGQAYLNFMGNEFGHPDWIDFPREGNGWSYRYAQRHWSLAGNGFLRYAFLEAFDKAMIALVRKYRILESGYAYNLKMDGPAKTMVFEHGGLVFVFNWHPALSTPDYPVPVRRPGKYRLLLDTDRAEFGGFSRLDSREEYFSYEAEGVPHIRVYNINRAAQVFERVEE